MDMMINTIQDPEYDDEFCKKAFVLAIKDSLNVVSGKWKLAIVCTLLKESRSFSGIERLLPAISPRMLARELRELEVNGVICKEQLDGQNARFSKYTLTESGKGLQDVIILMATWGQTHRAMSKD